jgi:P-type Ca2+ transporter type 2C
MLRTLATLQVLDLKSQFKTNARRKIRLSPNHPHCYLELMTQNTRVGLSSDEARARLAKFGPNELEATSRTGLLGRVVRILAEPMLLLLVAAGLVSIFLAEPIDAAVLLAMIAFVISITVYQEGRAEKALTALKSLSAPRALVYRDSAWVSIPGSDVVPGDLVRISEGDRVPADLIVSEASHLSVDESNLTGESIAVSKAVDQLMFAGTLAVTGTGIGQVAATGRNTVLGKISESLKSIKQDRTRLQQEIDRLVKVIAIVAVVAALSVSAILFFTRGVLADSLLAGIALAMAMIPEEFPVVLTLFFALGAWRMSKEKVLARKSSVIETLGSATVVCTDKTGTLTMNSMSVDSLLPAQDEARLTRFGSLATPPESFDPVDKAFLGIGRENPDLTLIREYPLRPELSAMTLVWESGDDWVVACKGSPEAVAMICGIDPAPLMAQVEKAAAGGRRIIAVAGAVIPKQTDLPTSQLDLAMDFQGLVALRDFVRPGVPQAIQECHEAGIRVIMITGDYLGTALEIAAEIGLQEGSAITGAEIEELSDEELAVRAKTLTVCARVTPNQKLRLIRALKANNEVVAMTGDGVNDAPALKLADISLAMGLRGTDVAREASNLIITDDDFTSIVAGIRRGRTIYAALRKAFAYIVAVHVPLLGMAIIPVLFFDWPLILLPAMVAFIEMVVDPACTIVFQAEPAEPNIMKRKPRPVNQAMLDRHTFTIAALQGLGVLGVAALLYFSLLSLGRAEDEVRTMSFALLVLANLMLILTNRSWTLSILATLRQRRNPTVKWIVSAAVIVLVALVQIPVLRELFNLGPISITDWAVVCAAALLSVLWFEIYKTKKTRALARA